MAEDGGLETDEGQAGIHLYVVIYVQQMESLTDRGMYPEIRKLRARRREEENRKILFVADDKTYIHTYIHAIYAYPMGMGIR